jgi:predicted nucleotide-binding protein
MSVIDDLFAVAAKLNEHSNRIKDKDFNGHLDELEKAAKEIGKAWSGSWVGYHSCVYYEGLIEPPPGAHFSQEWGLMDTLVRKNTGNWVEYRFGDVVDSINHIAGNPNISQQEKQSAEAQEYFEEAKSEILSCFSIVSESRPNDKFIEDLREKTEKQKILYAKDFIRVRVPSRAVSRDSTALGQGFQTPPHFSVLANVHALRQPLIACGELSKIASRLASHLKNQEQRSVRDKRVGTNVFIGHGSSPIWKDLKDFIQDRLHLPWDEFNRVPIAGVTNIARLSQMLDEAAIALLIMTAEDEQADGKLHARMNVVHEAGLFQGRLGFEKAIVILEDSCEEFSNIQGLGQIQFPKGNIKAVFEEIRRVLEREGLIEGREKSP